MHCWAQAYPEGRLQRGGRRGRRGRGWDPVSTHPPWGAHVGQDPVTLRGAGRRRAAPAVHLPEGHPRCVSPGACRDLEGHPAVLLCLGPLSLCPSRPPARNVPPLAGGGSRGISAPPGSARPPPSPVYCWGSRVCSPSCWNGVWLWQWPSFLSASPCCEGAESLKLGGVLGLSQPSLGVEGGPGLGWGDTELTGLCHTQSQTRSPASLWGATVSRTPCPLSCTPQITGCRGAP